jgi:S-adenosylmethionine-diacylglycerol 3-amino-3-carboxypropyl transferase
MNGPILAAVQLDALRFSQAGCNVLNLLLTEPRRIWAVDVSAAQTALVSLKLGAVKVLDREGFLELLGHRASARRIALYETVRELLSFEARAYWDENLHLIEHGLARAGHVERHFARFQKTALRQLILPGAVRRMFERLGAEERREHFATEIDRPAFRMAFAKHFGCGSSGRQAWLRFRQTYERVGGWGNPYLEFFLTSRYESLARAQPYLHPQLFGKLKRLASRVEVVTARVEEYIGEIAIQSLDAVNLSDVPACASQGTSDEVVGLMLEAVRPGGRICCWSRGRSPSPSDYLTPHLQSRRDLARRLWLRDRTWFYTGFHIAEVTGR